MSTIKLTPKQEAACQAYVLSPNNKIKGNKSAAYRVAYNTDNMKPESVNRLAKKLFDGIKIRSRVEELQNEIKSALIADEIELQEFWTSTMRGEVVVYIDPETGAEIKPEMKDRLKASEYMGKAKTMFVEKKQIDLNVSVADELEKLKQQALNAISGD